MSMKKVKRSVFRQFKPPPLKNKRYHTKLRPMTTASPFFFSQKNNMKNKKLNNLFEEEETPSHFFFFNPIRAKPYFQATFEFWFLGLSNR